MLKTLEELKLHNKRASNFCIVNDTLNFMYCGYMHIHDDTAPIKIKPLYWSADAVFVLWNSSKKIEYLFVEDFLKKTSAKNIECIDDCVFFDSRKKHALLPIKLAKKVINDSNYIYTEEYKEEEKQLENWVEPKLVWQLLK